MCKINYKDIVEIALIYNYEGNRSVMLSAEDVEEYKKSFFENLRDMSIEYSADLFDNREPIYYDIKDRNNNEYYILKQEILDDIWNKSSIGIYAWDLMVASQKENALSVLGLEIRDGNIVRKNVKKLIRK